MKKLLRFIQSHTLLAAMAISMAGPLSASAVTGTFAWAVETFNYPGGVVKVDNAGNVITAIRSAVNKYNSNGTPIWSASVITLVQDIGHIVVDSANNVYVVGKGASNSVVTIGVAKISPSGAILWAKTFNLNGGGGTAEHEASGPMVLGNNGSLYELAIGQIVTPVTTPVTILRINTSTGAEQNRIQMGTITTDLSNPMQNSTIALDSANNVYYGSPEGIRSYSADLQTVHWFNTQSAVRAVVCDAANNVYATGYTTNSNGNGDYEFVVERLNNANGTPVWNDELQMGGDPINDGNNLMCRGGDAIALDSKGQIYAAGGQNINADNIVKIDPTTGNIQWYTGQGGGKSADMAIAVDTYDNVYVVGTDSELDPSGKAVVYVYDPQAGDILWNQSYSLTNLGDVFNNVALDKNNGVYCIGNDNSPGAPGSGTVENIPTLVKYTESGLIVNGTYKIINRNSALAMEAFGAHTTNGTPIDQWAYHTGNNQQWTLTSLGGGQFSIIGVQSSRSLDVASYSTNNGALVDLYDHNGGANQQFSFKPTSNGYFLIIPAYIPGSCIEGKTYSTTNGTPVDLWQWQYNEGNNQQWIFQAP